MKVRDRARRLRDANRQLANLWPDGWATRRALTDLPMGRQADLVRSAETMVETTREREPFFALAA